MHDVTPATPIAVTAAQMRRASVVVHLVAHPDWSSARIAAACGVGRRTVDHIAKEFEIHRSKVRRFIRRGREIAVRVAAPAHNRKPQTPASARRVAHRTDERRYQTRRAEAVGREVSDRVAGYRMREERSTWKRLAVLSSLALGQIAPAGVFVELLLGNDIEIGVIEPDRLAGDVYTMTLPAELVAVVREVCGLWEEIEDDPKIADMERAFCSMLVERVRRGGVDV